MDISNNTTMYVRSPVIGWATRGYVYDSDMFELFCALM